MKFLKLTCLALVFTALSGVAQAGSLADNLGAASSVISTGILQGLAAKELCTCMYVIRMGDGMTTPPSSEDRLSMCLDRAELPVPTIALKLMIWIDVSRPNEVRVGTMGIGQALAGSWGHNAIARFEGDKLGCRLLTDEELQHEK